MNYVLYGEEQYLLRKSLDTIIKSYVKEDSDLNKVSYDATRTDLATILEDATTIPFFADYKVILIDHANFLSTSDDTDIDTQALANYLDAPMESTILIMIGDFEKLDARKKIVKKVQKTCKVLQYRRLDALGKQNYVQEEIKKRNITVEAKAMQVLLERLPLDVGTIQKEMDKLELYGDTISERVAMDLVNRPLDEDVFALVDAVVQKDLRKAFHLWQDLSVLNKDAIYLIALLAAQFRFLYQVKVLMKKGYLKEDIVKELHAHPYRVQLAMKSAAHLGVSELMHILEQLATLDQHLKSGRLDKKLGFEMFLLELQGV